MMFSARHRAEGTAALGRLLRRAAELAMSLPNYAADRYAEKLAELDADPQVTEGALRHVRERIGQGLFRAALLEFWGGACSVTGFDNPELLRASHAKPWASVRQARSASTSSTASSSPCTWTRSLTKASLLFRTPA